MSKREQTLQKYVGNMLSIEQSILSAVKRQSQADEVKLMPEANQLISKIEKTLNRHVMGLEQHLKNIGGGSSGGVMQTVAKALGVATGVLDQVRPDKVSEMLRDDYVSLNLAAIGYTMLCTTSLAFIDQITTTIASDNLKELTPLITEINEVMPQIVIQEISDESETFDSTITDEAIRLTQSAWDGDHVHQNHAHPWQV